MEIEGMGKFFLMTEPMSIEFLIFFLCIGNSIVGEWKFVEHESGGDVLDCVGIVAVGMFSVRSGEL